MLLVTQHYCDIMAMFTDRYKMQQHLGNCRNMCKAKWGWNRLRSMYLFTVTKNKTKIWNLLIHVHMLQFIFCIITFIYNRLDNPSKVFYEMQAVFPWYSYLKRMVFVLVIGTRLFIQWAIVLGLQFPLFHFRCNSFEASSSVTFCMIGKCSLSIGNKLQWYKQSSAL